MDDGQPCEQAVQPSVNLMDEGRTTASVSQVAGDVGDVTLFAHIEVESLNADNSFADLADMTAGVRSPSGVVTSTRLLQTAPGHYEADVAVGEPGPYQILARREDGGDVAAASETIGLSVPTGVEYLHAGTNNRLLSRISGGAAFLREAGEALDITGLEGEAPEREALWGWFLAPALMLLLLGVAVRRVDFRLPKKR